MISIREDGHVEFKFYRPGAHSVRIAGDFDNWTGSVEMRNIGRGWWVFDARLPAGEYRFRYIADGQWYTDFAAFGVEMSKQGWNSVLIVPEQSEAIEQPQTIEEQQPELQRVAA